MNGDQPNGIDHIAVLTRRLDAHEDGHDEKMRLQANLINDSLRRMEDAIIKMDRNVYQNGKDVNGLRAAMNNRFDKVDVSNSYQDKVLMKVIAWIQRKTRAKRAA